MLPIVHIPYRSLGRPSCTRQKIVPGHRGVKVYPMLFDKNVNTTRNVSSTPVCRYCFDPEWLFFMLVIALCIGFGLMPLFVKNSFTNWRSQYFKPNTQTLTETLGKTWLQSVVTALTLSGSSLCLWLHYVLALVWCHCSWKILLTVWNKINQSSRIQTNQSNIFQWTKSVLSKSIFSTQLILTLRASDHKLL